MKVRTKQGYDHGNYSKNHIDMCEEWRNDYQNFHNWAINNGYEEGLTLDRIDVNGDYSPDNCRWVTMAVQGNNRRARKNKTGFPGVAQNPWSGRYVATIRVGGKRINLGTFDTAEEAGEAYKKAKGK